MTFFDDDAPMDDGDLDPYDDEPGPVAPDRRNALAPPREMADIQGHKTVEKHLLALATGERIPHALIFTGPEGIGKATMAFRFARFLLSRSPPGDAGSGLFDDALALPAASPETLATDPQDPVFRRVAASAHPDLLSIEPAEGKKGVLVDDARRIGPFLRMTSSSGGWRVAIVDRADTMNRASQNAILKVLEEPPPRVMLILISQGLGALLPTIRSRCQVIDFKPLSGDDCLAVLARSRSFVELGESERDLVAAVSENSPGRALRYVEAGLPSVLGDAGEVLRDFPSIDWPKAHHLADFLSMPGNAAAYESLQEVFVSALQKSARARARGAEYCGLFSAMAARCTLETLVGICENLDRHFRQANMSNLDKRQTVLGAYSILKAGNR
ncbi:MAG: DNA polymerase III subunit delta' [Alphaproteobacteria bacterium]|nr:DNA polymerase III subunit delta' [Alphaproteobacteria bacterium]